MPPALYLLAQSWWEHRLSRDLSPCPWLLRLEHTLLDKHFFKGAKEWKSAYLGIVEFVEFELHRVTNTFSISQV